MKNILRGGAVLVLLVAAAGFGAAQAKPGTLKVVGLYSETSDGYVTTGSAAARGPWWPSATSFRQRRNQGERGQDWVEVIQATNPNAVYEIHGPDSGELVKKVTDILKKQAPHRELSEAERRQLRPQVQGQAGRHAVPRTADLYQPDKDQNDIKYGDVLDIKGKVRIIAINNTITLMNAQGKVTTVIGPLNFDVEKVLTNQQLYKYLNVP